MKVTARIAAVIINYKTPKLSLEAVRSLYSELDPVQDRIYIVDNFSNDGSLEELRLAILSEPWPLERIDVLASDYNGGFSYGNNFAMEKVQADAYLLLNSDALIVPGAVQMLWESLQENSKKGVVGPLVVGDDEASQISSFVNHSPGNEFLTTAKTGVFTKLLGFFGVKEVASLPATEIAQDVDWLSFVCVLIRGKAYQDIGAMDDGYFMYSEDNDYCRRAWIKEWQVCHIPRAKIIHLNKGLSAKQWERHPAFFYQSRARYFRKFYGLEGYILANTLWIIGRLIHLVREIIQNRPPSVAEYAWRDIWTFTFGTKPIKETEIDRKGK